MTLFYPKNDTSRKPACTVVKVEKTVDFDNMCIRLDFNESLVNQLEPGSSNGIQLRIQVPKAYNGVFNKTVVRRFPRKRYTFDGDWNKREDLDSNRKNQVFNQEMFLMVHDKSLKMPTTTSPEVSVIYLRNNQIAKISINNNLEIYQHDPVETNHTCDNFQVPLYECLYNSINCKPLEGDTRCPVIYKLLLKKTTKRANYHLKLPFLTITLPKMT